MKQQVLIVSHCFLNDGVKLTGQDEAMQAAERSEKRNLLQYILENNIELIQLPCPEFILYGSKRWGHASSQFDTPFFRNEVRKMLDPIVLQLKEYANHAKRFEILGILGIDGSPSCGIDFTYDGNWGGELTGNELLPEKLRSLTQVKKPGIMMDEFQNMLRDASLAIPFYSLETFGQTFPAASNRSRQ